MLVQFRWVALDGRADERVERVRATRLRLEVAGPVSAAGVAEAAAAVVAVERLDHLPLDFLDSLQHQLGDAVAALHVERLAVGRC